jgi:hypothetical protein
MWESFIQFEAFLRSSVVEAAGGTFCPAVHWQFCRIKMRPLQREIIHRKMRYEIICLWHGMIQHRFVKLFGFLH